MLPHPPGASSSLPSRPCPQPCGHRPGLQEGVQGHPRPWICALGKATALGDTSDGGPPPHLWDPVSRLCEAEEQGFRVVEGTWACMKRAWVSGVILPVTRAFQPIHSVPAHGRGRELRVYPVLWAGAGHSGPCYTPPIHAPHLDLCCGGSSSTSRVGFRHCTPRRGGVLVPYLPARRLLPHTLLAAGGSVALTTRGSAHTALSPKRDTHRPVCPWSTNGPRPSDQEGPAASSPHVGRWVSSKPVGPWQLGERGATAI